jgi:non-ribosomal peptide synthetase component E (peptide arylation enzyme)
LLPWSINWKTNIGRLAQPEMKTSSDERIKELTASGAWGNETLHGLLALWCQRAPNRLAVADQPNCEALTGNSPHRFTFAELDNASDMLAAKLLSLGIGADSRVMVQLPNTCELVVCYYALSKLGAVISPVPVQYRAHELGSMAATLLPELFIGIHSLRGEPLAELANKAIESCPTIAFGRELALSSDADDTAKAAVAAHRTKHPDDANTIISICWTSGTTGTPKGVPRSHNMWLATARSTINAGDYREGDVLLNPFPLVNMAAVGGFLYPAALKGCSLVLHHPLEPAVYLQQLSAEAVNFSIAPPALLNQLAKDSALWQQFDFGSLRAIGSGSAPLSPEMIATFDRDYGVPVVNFYGSNEGISLFATPANAADPRVRATMFPRAESTAQALYSQVIDQDTGVPITEADTPGELCFGGATVFDGYLGHSNDDVFNKQGLFRTGDLVEICGDPPDYYRIVGRCKDIINRGGMKISPSELDVLLEAFPGLTEAAVCPYPDDRLGEKICACLVPVQGEAAPTLTEVCQYLSDTGLAKFKLPERIALLEKLPRNPMGKVLRGELAQQLSTQESSDD